MLKTTYLFVICLALLMFTACPPPEGGANEGGNNGANNGTTEKTVAATLQDIDKSFGEAWKNKNGAHFDQNLTDSFVGGGASGFVDKASVVRMINESPCEVRSYSTSEYKVVELSENAALLAGKGTNDATCDGQKVPENEYYGSLYVKEGDTWKAAYYQNAEVPAAAGDGDAEDSEDGDSNANTSGNTANAEAEKADASDDEAEKEEPPKPNIQNDAELAKTLIDMDKKFWDAFFKKDTKVFEDGLGSSFLAVGSDGIRDRAAEIAYIGEHKCEISSYTLSDEKATKVNDNFVVLTYAAASKGTCDGQPMPEKMYTASVYMKDGDSWKPVMHMNSVAREM
ncbi:MAG: DUF4440 domain-containing protein [Acidobacteria bacterium]|nr:MAG: DUF4440 domain-containing protein [Acidobacteriota bacterium]REJ98198.1 MAG: DUF4440 domain-containing protein [Acidobacteriota bacterium]REK16942.1 MAG: DUF4440 domain-containing protein [Acidobacteriota bacterium]REK42852.1 MAG: DUF4440 domain-containing protein [Acidobacteriota bacterium]